VKRLGFVIELTHKHGGDTCYVCAVPTGPNDYTNTVVTTLAEARRYPYPSAEVAAHVVTTFPPTKNVIYTVIEIADTAGRAAGAGK